MNDPDPLFQFLVNYLAEGEMKERIIVFHYANLDAFRIFPASHANHHCYPGGYYEHVLEVANNALTMLPLCVLDECRFTVDDLCVAVYFHDIDKACSYVAGESFRYVFDSEPATRKQLDYARELGVEVAVDESKTSISYKIDCAKSGEPIDPFQVPRFSRRPDRLPMDDGAIVCSIAARHGITFSEQALSAICLHHGGWAPLVAGSKYSVNPTPLGVLLHTADFISSHCQNGRSLGR
jgi:hypothetical protein